MGVFCCCCCRIYYQSFYIDFMTKPLSIYTTAHKLHEKRKRFIPRFTPYTKDLCRGLIVCYVRKRIFIRCSQKVADSRKIFLKEKTGHAFKSYSSFSFRIKRR